MADNGIIIFEKSAVPEMLDIFGITVDAEGYLVKKEDPSVKIVNNGPIHISDFAGISKGNCGELIYLKNDIGSLIELVDKIKESKQP
jgi:hypothetical protein